MLAARCGNLETSAGAEVAVNWDQEKAGTHTQDTRLQPALCSSSVLACRYNCWLVDGDTASTLHLQVCLEPGVSGHPALLHHLLGVAQDAAQPHPGQCARVLGHQLKSDDGV